MSTAAKLDPVAEAFANAPIDERAVTDEELAALRQARADKRPFVSGAVVSADIAERARREG